MRIFLDTNIVIDYLTGRVAESVDAERLFQLSNFKDVELVMTDLTIVNIVYICKKAFPLEVIYDKVEQLMGFVRVIGIGSQAVRNAVMLRTKDFEDAVQYYAARSYGCEYIVSRNAKDFRFSSIPVLTAKEMVDEVMA